MNSIFTLLGVNIASFISFRMPVKISSEMMKLENQMVPDRQLDAAYQSTRIDHEIKLNVNCNPSPARLTGIMITLGIEQTKIMRFFSIVKFCEKNSITALLPNNRTFSGGENSQFSDMIELLGDNVNLVRVNVSHQDKTWHRQTIKRFRDAIRQHYGRSNLCIRPPAMALDLKGPEIRTGISRKDSGRESTIRDLIIMEGNKIKLFCEEAKRADDDSEGFWTTCPDLLRLSRVGDRIIVDRGAVMLEVNQIGEQYVICKVKKTGVVKDGKIVQAMDTPLNLPQISEQDDSDIDFASDLECDFLIASYTRSWKGILAIKDRIKKKSPRPICVLAKISTYQGVEAFDDILKVADGIVVDREGLQVELKSEKLFLAQKSMISKCNRIGKPVVVTFRVTSDGQTKFELGLVANAVLEGADCIFLATGSLRTKETSHVIMEVDAVCREAECARWQRQIFQELSYKATIPLDSTHAVAIAAVELSMKLNASAIIVTTTTGRSAMLLSIYRPRCPVVAITRYEIASRWLQIFFGVHPVHYRCPPNPDWLEDFEARIQCAMNYLRHSRFVGVGDAIVVVGSWRRSEGFTNSIRVIYFSSPLIPNIKADFEETW